MSHPSKVILFRHGEKPSGTDPNLSVRGRARAAALAWAIPDEFGTPAALFATLDSENSDRPLQTIQPLADRLGLKVDDKFQDKDVADAASKILDAKHAGQLVAVCWHHGKIPELAAALGVSHPPTPWDPDVFDHYWVINWAGGTAQLSVEPQKLLFGDSPAVPSHARIAFSVTGHAFAAPTAIAPPPGEIGAPHAFERNPGGGNPGGGRKPNS
jgi:hypothetical protein